jgi:hypothetical protein
MLRSMPRRAFFSILGLPLLTTVVLGAGSCSSSKPATALGAGCSINSDCNGALICAYGLCHLACVTSKDCTGGATCLPPGVCELPKESACSSTLPCVTGLVCASDSCKAPCSPGISAGSPGGCQPDQTCSTVPGAAQSVCLDPSDDGGTPDGSSSGTDGSSGGDSAGGSDGGGGESGPVCTPPANDGGSFGYNPSNFDPGMLAIVDGGVPDGGGALTGTAIDWTKAPAVTIAGTCDYGCLPPPITVTMSGGTQAWLFAMQSLTIPTSTTLTLTATNTATIEQPPVIFAVLTTVDIQGTLDASAMQGHPGPGANGATGGGTQGTGGGGSGFGTNYPDSSPGGGSFCGVGGTGGYWMLPGAPAGALYGNATLVPLVAGSGGGFGHSDDAFGAGGGALQISAGQSIIVRSVGTISAGGGGAFRTAAGGSGGAILLEAPSFTLNGIIAANGGGGGAYAYSGSYATGGADGSPSAIPAPGGAVDGFVGGAGSAGTNVAGGNGENAAIDASVTELTSAGGGGAGWIRINSACPSIAASATVSPSLTTSCATQGPLP